MNEKQIKIFNECKRYFFMILGCLFYSGSLCILLIPNEIVGGGVSGAASLIQIVTGLPAGVFIVLINAPILLGGLKLMGWQFILRCLITTLTLGVCTELLSALPQLTDNALLASVYGGIFQGVAVGFFIRYETSSGGTELLGRISRHIFKVGSIATHVALFDGLVVIIGAFVMHNPENVLYALILIFVSVKVSDMIVLGLDKAKLCYIITDKAIEISDFLIANSPRGVTLIQGEGMYSKKPHGVLLTCVKKNQIVPLKSAIKQLDENAFVIVCEANEVYGKGFHQI